MKEWMNVAKASYFSIFFLSRWYYGDDASLERGGAYMIILIREKREKKKGYLLKYVVTNWGGGVFHPMGNTRHLQSAESQLPEKFVKSS